MTYPVEILCDENVNICNVVFKENYELITHPSSVATSFNKYFIEEI